MGTKLPKGFTANGIHSGLKKKRKDLSLFFSSELCEFAALFTKNVVKAAPIIVGEDILERSKGLRAVIVNSGNANCMTGDEGIKDAKRMCSITAKALGVKENEVFVSSTGIIGRRMDLTPVEKGMKDLVGGLSVDGFQLAAEGIMTTDKFMKVATAEFKLNGKKVIISGVTKGAGMVKPEMATMLAYILTDASISKSALLNLLKEVNDETFNAITVDGDMSTNDTVVLLANGKAGNRKIESGDSGYLLFKEHLADVMTRLAKMIVEDGEGASRIMDIKVKGAGTKKEARQVAGAIADSLLLKCAVHGGDPNWGRVAAAAGAAGVDFDPDKMEIALDNVVFFRNAKCIVPSKAKRNKVFKGKEVEITVDLHEGQCDARMWASDMTREYIKINSFYST
ncbi:MAG: bifunctional glutamate N-acetyltransferase/amino-acid acetyltransferase ArgJ [Candidatus Omnitrophica bacterium]|nr:bifunctional glutamate N-acetyltransferase/amino-acid acetyltransferase ArgJ [Candidatus Omnitrophota bacterium]